jgi:hypothetical protein
LTGFEKLTFFKTCFSFIFTLWGPIGVKQYFLIIEWFLIVDFLYFIPPILGMRPVMGLDRLKRGITKREFRLFSSIEFQ